MHLLHVYGALHPPEHPHVTPVRPPARPIGAQLLSQVGHRVQLKPASTLGYFHARLEKAQISHVSSSKGALRRDGPPPTMATFLSGCSTLSVSCIRLTLRRNQCGITPPRAISQTSSALSAICSDLAATSAGAGACRSSASSCPLPAFCRHQALGEVQSYP